MKKLCIIFYLSAVTTPLSHIIACPTCVGKIRAESPPFFSHEFYQAGKLQSNESKELIAHNQLKKLIEAKKGKK
jgi:hypothetical protein